METVQELKTVKIDPGSIRVHSSPDQLATVVSYGVALAIFDMRLRYGGLCHFVYPSLPDNMPATAKFARPSVVAMIKLFLEAGSNLIDLEVNIFGASENPEADERINRIAKANLVTAIKILTEFNIKVGGMDVGGSRGRKIVFNPTNGETVVAKVENLRSADWQFN